MTGASALPQTRVLIAGSYGQGNTGDEAILEAMLADLRAGRPGLQIQVVSGNPAATAAQHGVQALFWGDWSAIAEALEGAGLLILGGGGIFFDYWGFDPRRLLENEAPDLAHYASFPLLAWLLGKPVMIWACGVGPLFTGEGREAVRLAFNLASRASVRDAESKRLLEEIGVPPGRVEVTADPAFALPVAGPERVEALLAGQGLAPGRPLLGLVPRPWDVAVDPEEWEKSLAGAVAPFARERQARILLIPFHAGHDDPSLARLRDRLLAAGLDSDGVRLLPPGCSPGEIAGLIGRCDLLVGLRLHSILFAVLAGTPAVALAYDPKVRHLIRLTGHEELCRDLTSLAGLRQLLEETWGRREEIRSDFLRTGERLRKAAARNAELAGELLDGFLAAPGLAGPDLDALRRLAGTSLAARLRDLRSRDALIQERGAQIERAWQDMERYRTWLQDQQRIAGERAAALEGTQEELARTQEELERTARELEHTAHERDGALAAQGQLREQRDILLGERNDLERRLTAIESTVAFRLVSRFWGVMRRLFPEGSWRRKLYRGLRRIAAGRLDSPAEPGTVAPSSPVPLELPADAGSGPAPADPWGDLLRFEDWIRDKGAPRVVVIVSATQLLESEGQRPTQLALGLSRRGVPVVFVYWRWWDHEWCAQDRLDEGIVQIPIDVVTGRPERLTSSFAGLSRVLLFEFPHPSFFELLAAANADGWVTAYDVLDDWEEFHRVGQAVWYDEAVERHLITAVDAVFAINEVLAGRIRELGGNAVEVVGNGLKPGLEVVREPRPLARGEVTVGYFGYLAGAWFDWQLIAGAARRKPSWRFYLIGYGGSPEGVELPGNVVLLGKQPQSDLAAFAVNWDVAVIPFKPDRLAAGADPIKTYEYLAMGLPVVVTGVHPPAGGEAFVRRTEGAGGFVHAIEEAAAHGAADAEARRGFAASCTWEHRLDALLTSLAEGRQRVAEKRALLGIAS